MDAGDLEDKAFRRKNARHRCPRCGAYSLEVISGEKLNPETHWPEVKYKICGGCGYEIAITGKRR